MRVLLVEDEKRLGDNVAEYLKHHGNFRVDIARTGTEGIRLLKLANYHLVILDIMLPGINGFEILSWIRRRKIKTLVIFLTARDAKEDLVLGLNEGADDYLVKPFDLAELLARCNALVRRKYNHAKSEISIGQMSVDLTARVVTIEDDAIDLTETEFTLLKVLLLRLGQVVSKREIGEYLYQYGCEKFSNVVEVYISSLRRKLGSDLIQTKRGRGYIIEGKE